MPASVLAIGFTVASTGARAPATHSAGPQAVEKVQMLQEVDRERAKARLRQRAAERWEQMTPVERLRAKRRLRQAGDRLQEMRSGHGYIDRERARARARSRLYERAR
jgi:hypothetical protein